MVFGDRTPACRECTLPREDQNSRIYATIPRQTTIGPVLQVHITRYLDISGIDIQIPSTTTKDRKSWIVIWRGKNRNVEELQGGRDVTSFQATKKGEVALSRRANFWKRDSRVALIRRAQKMRLKQRNCGNVTFHDETFKTRRSNWFVATCWGKASTWHSSRGVWPDREVLCMDGMMTCQVSFVASVGFVVRNDEKSEATCQLDPDVPQWPPVYIERHVYMYTGSAA